MKKESVISQWLNQTPDYASLKTVETVLHRVFGEDAICKKTGDSHQLRIKHPALAELPGFEPFGFLSIPVSKGQRVKGYYLRRIAQAVKHLEEIGKLGE
jgi:hypothetical protein